MIYQFSKNLTCWNHIWGGIELFTQFKFYPIPESIRQRITASESGNYSQIIDIKFRRDDEMMKLMRCPAV